MIDHAEDGGVRADPNRQREDRHCRKAWALPHHAERIAHVLDDSLEPHPAPHLAHLLSHVRDAAQLPLRGVGRCRTRQTTFAVFFASKVKMDLELTARSSSCSRLARHGSSQRGILTLTPYSLRRGSRGLRRATRGGGKRQASMTR